MKDIELIAEFMGLETCGTEYVWVNVHTSDLVPSDSKERCSVEIRNDEKCIRIPALYKTSWKWLMPLVEEIESKGYPFTISGNYCLIEDAVGSGFSLMQDDSTNGKDKKESIFLAAIEFIKWYKDIGRFYRKVRCFGCGEPTDTVDDGVFIAYPNVYCKKCKK